MTVRSYDHLVGFGEAMLRLSAPIGESLERCSNLAVHVGGAELNGLITAAAFGMPSTWVSAVGDDAAGRRIIRHVESHHVTHCLVTIADARTGLYFVEMAPFPRASSVFYDRSGSAASHLDRGMINWGDVLNSRSCLYFSGITAAISSSARASLEEAIDHAVGIGATIALDVNYRCKLWSEHDAFLWTKRVLPSIDILSVSHGDLEALDQPTDDIAAAREALGVDTLVVTTKRQVAGSVTATVSVANAERSFSASGDGVLVDPFGAGDAMIGAFIANLPSRGIEVAAERALNATIIAYGIHGDALSVDPNSHLYGRGILR